MFGFQIVGIIIAHTLGWYLMDIPYFSGSSLAIFIASVIIIGFPQFGYAMMQLQEEEKRSSK